MYVDLEIKQVGEQEKYIYLFQYAYVLLYTYENTYMYIPSLLFMLGRVEERGNVIGLSL